ncbi:MAG: Rrf2 family transcriptional regulator [Deferrisomatales bacterium]|nr:Rrf2 family transcriptional regulator [Deferrisomatales bacterium]
MRLTTRSRYGVRAVFDLAYHSAGEPVQIKTIAERQRIGLRYLEQIFQQLKDAGLLGSKRGPAGGYFLLKSPADITVYDVVTATEGPIELVFCAGEPGVETPCDTRPCDRKGECPAGELWEELGERIAEIFRGTTIEDLCRQAEALGLERVRASRLMFHI